MTDTEIIFTWKRSERNMKAIIIISQLSKRKIADIIHLLAVCGLIKGGWNNKQGVKIVPKRKYGRI